MRFLRTLGEGDKFRPAIDRQPSLNARTMRQESEYRITRVFPQSPYTVIAVWTDDPSGGFYSLGPGTVVLLPKEFNPSQDEVVRFLAPRGRKQVVGYRLLWDGKSNLSSVTSPQGAAAIRLMFAMGRREYGLRELYLMFEEHFEKFYGRLSKSSGGMILFFYRRRLVDCGLLEEVVDVAPATSAIREANLQEVV